jgi:membrane protein implicated in regulation of membrane protease activity
MALRRLFCPDGLAFTRRGVQSVYNAIVVLVFVNPCRFCLRRFGCADLAAQTALRFDMCCSGLDDDGAACKTKSPKISSREANFMQLDQNTSIRVVSMATIIYSVSAVVGGTVLVCQFFMTLLGLGHDLPDDLPDDVPHDFHFGHDGGDGAGHDGTHGTAHHESSFIRMLTFRTVIAAMTFFGLAGLAGGSADLPGELTLVVALAAGVAAMYVVHWLMRTLQRLKSDGTVRIERSVGRSGTVYLRIPAGKSGAGKIQLNVQNRTMEYEAMTSRDPLPAGTKVVVVNVLGPDTVEVEPVPEPERTAHV